MKEEHNVERKEKIKLWGESIQCHYFVYKPEPKPLAKLTSKPATDSSFVTDFSMEYHSKKTNGTIPAKVPAPEPKVCFSFNRKK